MGKSNENKEDNIFEARHSLHEHPLRHQKAQGPYKCNGCKQPGFTTCFKCPKDICDFYLHEDCFQAEHSPYKTHKFMEKSNENKEDNIFEARHSLHEHPLRHQKAQGPYKCNGCKQPGFTTCFKCPEDICDFYLHEDCFQAEHSPYKTHKFMEKCKFYYHDSSSCVADKYCNGCGLDTLGFRYECSTHDENPHDLHPTCANIDFEMDWDGLKLKLRNNVESKCLHCNQRNHAEEGVGFTGWKWLSEERDYGFPFRSSCRNICFHVKCMNEIMAPKENKFDEYEMYHKCSIE